MLFTVTGKDLGVVVSKNIKTPKDLEGRSVGTAIRTSAEYYMYRYFEKYGVDPTKVNVRNINPTNPNEARYPQSSGGNLSSTFPPELPQVYQGARLSGAYQLPWKVLMASTRATVAPRAPTRTCGARTSSKGSTSTPRMARSVMWTIS